METELGRHVLDDIAFVFAQQRRLAEAAALQINDTQFFATPDGLTNSIAVMMKHVGGNLRSRWSDFLNSDGEKPDRNRDGEFVAEKASRADILQIWNNGWQTLESTLGTLQPEDLQRTVLIRGEPHTVTQALVRSLAHASHHAGQIVFLAKVMSGPGWKTLSIPRGGSAQVLGNFWVGSAR